MVSAMPYLASVRTISTSRLRLRANRGIFVKFNIRPAGWSTGRFGTQEIANLQTYPVYTPGAAWRIHGDIHENIFDLKVKDTWKKVGECELPSKGDFHFALKTGAKNKGDTDDWARFSN